MSLLRSQPVCSAHAEANKCQQQKSDIKHINNGDNKSDKTKAPTLFLLSLFLAIMRRVEILFKPAETQLAHPAIVCRH